MTEQKVRIRYVYVIFLVAKDTRHGLYGPPVDGVEDGPRFLPGFGPKK